MNKRLIAKLTFMTLLILVMVSVISAFAANNSVPVTRLTNQAFAITANALKPPECASINLTGIVIGEKVKGTGGNDLIIGTSGFDNLGGGGGSDCILGGDGDDILNGGKGNGDVCIGGLGNDTFKGCDTEIQ
jgi:Ca2+-binding RTX toxin-like protein